MCAPGKWLGVFVFEPVKIMGVYLPKTISNMTYTSIKKEINDLKHGKGCQCSKSKLSSEISKAYANYLADGKIDLARKVLALRHEL